MKRGYIITGICFLCFVTWGILLFTLFEGSDLKPNQLSTTNNETIIIRSNGVEFQQLEEDVELTKGDLSLEDSYDSISDTETTSISNDNNSVEQLIDSPETDERNSGQFKTEDISIKERGIQPGDFDGLTTDGVISVDVVLDVLANKENSE